MNHAEALKILGIPQDADLSTLKTAFRALSFKRHPDHGGTDAKFIELTAAYDLASEYCVVGMGWEKEQSKNMEKWEDEFRKQWRIAYQKSQSQKPDDGMHFNTCVENFRRAYIYPPQEWFLNALFSGQPKIKAHSGYSLAEEATKVGDDAKTYYRRHLMRIAPNKRMAESYAKKYWELEFESKWVFYLPASVELLRSFKEVSIGR